MATNSTWRKLHDHPELWDRYFVRETIIKAIRQYFEREKFHEVETPLLISHPPAESYVDVFATTLLDRQRRPTPAYLSTSPEMPLKKLLVAGIGNCYSLTKSFRNMETQSTLHNPEFTILEWYRVGATYHDIMKDCEALLLAINERIRGGNTVPYQGKTIHLSPPWERITMAESFRVYAGIDFDAFLDFEIAKKIALKKGYTVEETTTWEELYNQIFLNEVEPHLGKGRPTIIYEFPAAVAALSNRVSRDPRYCERFEFYIEGLELGDAYDELTDPNEIKTRFDEQMAEIKRLGKTNYEYDHDFIEALNVGLPKSAGIAVGVDRLVMLFADTSNIADTLFFPVGDLFDQGK